MKIIRIYSLALLLSPAFAQSAPAADPQRWWQHVKVLADDNMEGRETGSPGLQRAADYIIKNLQANGIEPAGSKGYYQPIKFTKRMLDESKSRVALTRDGKTQQFKLGDDAAFSLRSDLAPYAKAELVFVGYGLQVPEANYDDLADQDLKGKIAVYIGGAPASIPSDLASHYSFAGHRWKAFKAAGVIGTINIPNPKTMDIPWERSMRGRLHPQMRLAEESLDESAGWGVQLTWNPAKAEVLFEGSGHTLAELLALADARQPMPRFPLRGTLETRTSMKYSPVDSFNLVAKLPGSDPVLKNEYIVLTAHMDHIGIAQTGTDRINNGAVDNASGTAMLLEVSDLLKKSGTRPKRSILFVFLTAEEKGLLGSRYFAMNPTVPRKDLAGNINIDMFMPINPPQKVIVRGMAESDLGDWAKESVKSVGAEPIVDPEPQRNSFIRSDQYNFIRQGVPAVVMTIGYAKGTPEEKVVHQWLRERYHAPGDDLAQPINFEAAKKYEEILAALLLRAANAEKRPEWHPDSFFRRFAK
jgi:hypothetical protein